MAPRKWHRIVGEEMASRIAAVWKWQRREKALLIHEQIELLVAGEVEWALVELG